MTNKILSLVAVFGMISLGHAYTSQDYLSLCTVGRDTAGNTNASYPRGNLNIPHVDGTASYAMSIYCRGNTGAALFQSLQAEGKQVERRTWTANNIVDTIKIKFDRSSACYYSHTKKIYWCHIDLSANKGLIGAFERVKNTDPRRLDPVEKQIWDAYWALRTCISSQYAFFKTVGNIFDRHVEVGCVSGSSLPGSKPEQSLAARAFTAVSLLSDRSDVPNLRGVPVVKKVSEARYNFGNEYWSAGSYCQYKNSTYTCAFEADL